MKRRIALIVFPALFALTLGSCLNQKKMARKIAGQGDEKLFTEYLGGKEYLKDTAVTYAVRQLPKIMKLLDKMIDPGMYHKKAILVLIKAWGQDSVAMVIYEKNVIRFEALSPDNELDLNKLIRHDERVMESLPDGIRENLKEYVLSKNEDLFWGKAILGENQKISQKIIAGDYAPETVELYYSVTGDTALAHTVTKMISSEMILKYKMQNSAPAGKRWKIGMEMPLDDGIKFLEESDSFSEVKKFVQARLNELKNSDEAVALYKKRYLSKKQVGAILLYSAKTAKEKMLVQKSYPEIFGPNKNNRGQKKKIVKTKRAKAGLIRTHGKTLPKDNRPPALN